MGKIPVMLGAIAGAIVVSSLAAGLFVYSSVPAATNAAVTSSSSSQQSTLNYLVSPGGCSASYWNGTAYAEPCVGYTVDQAKVFNCSMEAATSTGCTRLIWSAAKTMPMEQTVNGVVKQYEVPVLNNTMTVWYPHVDQTGNMPSWANCMFHVEHGPRSGFGPYGLCIAVNSTAFVVGTPGSALPRE